MSCLIASDRLTFVPFCMTLTQSSRFKNLNGLLIETPKGVLCQLLIAHCHPWKLALLYQKGMEKTQNRRKDIRNTKQTTEWQKLSFRMAGRILSTIQEEMSLERMKWLDAMLVFCVKNEDAGPPKQENESVNIISKACQDKRTRVTLLAPLRFDMQSTYHVRSLRGLHLPPYRISMKTTLMKTKPFPWSNHHGI